MTEINMADVSRGEASPDGVVLLANRNARGVNRRTLSEVAGLLRLQDRAIREIGRDGSARTLATEAVRSGVRCVVAAGGDGTLHEIVQVLARTRAALGILPLGTSNDLARRLSIPRKLREAVEVLRTSRSTAIDVLNIGGERVATIGGLGLAAHIARDANNARTVPALRPLAAALGGAVYPLAAATRIARRGAQAFWYSLQCNEDPPVVLRATTILFGLTRWFGGGLSLVPEGSPSGVGFNALAVTATTRRDLMQTLLEMKAGRPGGGRTRSYSGLHRLVIQTRGLVGAFGDGEWLGLRHRLMVTIEQSALRVLVPPHSATAMRSGRQLREAV